MNVDNAARDAVRALREQVVQVPDLETLVVRGRRQRARKRWATTVAVAAVAIAIAVPVGLVASENHAPQGKVLVRGSSTPIGVAAQQIQAGWTRIPNAFTNQMFHAFVHQAAAGPPGFVTVGYRCVPGCPTGEPTIPAIWYSPDGTSWTAVSAEAMPSSGTSVDAVAYWNNQFWAISEGDQNAPIWTSTDGEIWTARPSPTLATSLDANDTPYKLVADQLGLIAYTSGGAAFSSDGGNWQTTDLPPRVSGITRFGSELVALVDEPVPHAADRVEVFTSNDALHWTQGTDLGARVDPGSATITTWNGALWAVTYPSSSAHASAVWRSNDGITWSHPATPESPAGTVFDQLIPVGHYLVATGFDTDSRPGGWVTTDGSDWTPMPSLGRPPGGRLDIAAGDGNALVAVSSSGLDDVYRWQVPTLAGADGLRTLFTRTTAAGIVIVARAGLMPVAAASECPRVPVPSTQPANVDCVAGTQPGVEFDFSTGGRAFRATVLDRDVPPATGPDLEPMITLAEIREVLPDGESVLQPNGPSPYLVILHATKIAEVRVDPTRTTAEGLDEMTPVDGWVAFAASSTSQDPFDTSVEGLDPAGRVIKTALPWRCC